MECSLFQPQHSSPLKWGAKEQVVLWMLGICSPAECGNVIVRSCAEVALSLIASEVRCLNRDDIKCIARQYLFMWQVVRDSDLINTCFWRRKRRRKQLSSEGILANWCRLNTSRQRRQCLNFIKLNFIGYFNLKEIILVAFWSQQLLSGGQIYFLLLVLFSSPADTCSWNLPALPVCTDDPDLKMETQVVPCIHACTYKQFVLGMLCMWVCGTGDFWIWSCRPHCEFCLGS